jgi:exodeoxyribonuclease VII small subunit
MEPTNNSLPEKTAADVACSATFEQSLEKLEQIVMHLEEGRLGLSESLACYQEGIEHLQKCYQSLRETERKIELLAGVDAEGNPVCEPFDDEALSLQEKAESRSRRRSGTAPRRKSTENPIPRNDMDTPGGLF